MYVNNNMNIIYNNMHWFNWLMRFIVDCLACCLTWLVTTYCCSLFLLQPMHASCTLWQHSVSKGNLCYDLHLYFTPQKDGVGYIRDLLYLGIPTTLVLGYMAHTKMVVWLNLKAVTHSISSSNWMTVTKYLISSKMNVCNATVSTEVKVFTINLD